MNISEKQQQQGLHPSADNMQSWFLTHSPKLKLAHSYSMQSIMQMDCNQHAGDRLFIFIISWTNKTKYQTVSDSILWIHNLLSEASSPAGNYRPWKQQTSQEKRKERGGSEASSSWSEPCSCTLWVTCRFLCWESSERKDRFSLFPNRRGQRRREEGARVKTKQYLREKEGAIFSPAFSPAVTAGEGKWGDCTECWLRCS